MNETSSTIVIQRQLDRLKAGDACGRDAIVAFAVKRLEKLAHHMLQGCSHVAKFEESGDLLQRAAIRLQQALEGVVPENTVDLLRLTAQHMLFELNDLARYYRRRRLADQNERSGVEASSAPALENNAADTTHHPGNLAAWTEVHDKIEAMPDELRQVVELLWYHEIDQSEAAELLGIARRTIIRRWEKAWLLSREVMPG